jgi:3-hydroxyisobutyrate dehydrogenase-like beta-hydroxyacid dehydrogenase
MRITVIGLGIIGGVWARHLATDGHAVRTWNRTPKPGAPGFTADLAAAVRGAELVAIVVADPPAVKGVLERIAGELGAGMVVAQHSTIGVDDTRAAAKLVQGRGALYLDMPFTGSKPAAEQRQNVFFIGDDAQALGRVEAVYRTLAKVLVPVGGVGQASAIKLAFNLLIANLNQAMAESFELARRSGIDPVVYFNALDANVAKSGLADLKKPKYLSGDYSPQFSIKHMHKDLRLALGLAKDLGLELAETATVERAYAEAARRGMGDLDFAALLEIVRKPAG